MAEDDIPDYMADLEVFLHEVDSSKKAPSRPKLGRSSGADQFRPHSLPGNLTKKERKKLAEEEERTKLAVGLSAPIEPSNVGFKMLMKMGFTPGAAVGKSHEGILEPVEMAIKRNRLGLGKEDVEEEERRKREARKETERSKQEEREKSLQRKFGEERSKKWKEVKLKRDFWKAKKVLLSFAEKEKGRESVEIRGSDVGWGYEGVPEKVLEMTEEDEDGRGELNHPPDVKRRRVFQEEEEADKCAEGEESSVEEEEISQESVDALLESLRENHFYCLYCGCQYPSKSDLESVCPGRDEDNH